MNIQYLHIYKCLKNCPREKEINVNEWWTLEINMGLKFRRKLRALVVLILNFIHKMLFLTK